MDSAAFFDVITLPLDFFTRVHTAHRHDDVSQIMMPPLPPADRLYYSPTILRNKDLHATIVQSSNAAKKVGDKNEER